MKILRPISILAGSLMLATAASAQISLTPPAAEPPAAAKPAPKAAPKPPAAAKKPPAPVAAPKPPPTPSPPVAAAPTPAPDDPNVDMVYGAYQRGQYRTAFDLATVRAQAGDPKAMTMLGELYSNALGIKRDYAKAGDWYKRAADAGDREAMFALAMMRIAGRGGPLDKQDGVRLLASAA
ncbi:MAG TPA: tetratricopeptide repeat protein, partial [Bradyrhizobium sp.]|nr:tetratricopeptide repeat protein [Bradyrhizobium sp.]